MKINLKKTVVLISMGMMLSACSDQASVDEDAVVESSQEETTKADTEEVLSPQFKMDEEGNIIVEKDSPLPFGKTIEEVKTIIGTDGEEKDPYADENDVSYREIDYNMIWFDYENPIVTCFTFMEDSLVKIELEMDQHVTKELAREIMTSCYGEADETEISDYGTVCIWEDVDNDRRFVLIPDEYDRYVVEITSLSDEKSSSVRTEITAVASEGEAMTGEFGSFESMDLDMNPVNQDILKDHKLTMINVWGTFCGPCLSEMPSLGELHTEYEDKGFQIVGIVTDVVNQDGTISESQIKVAKDYAEKTGATYLHLLPTVDLYEIILKDVVGVPTTVFVDENGNILKDVVGAQSKEQWKKDIDELLETLGE